MSTSDASGSAASVASVCHVETAKYVSRLVLVLLYGLSVVMPHMSACPQNCGGHDRASGAHRQCNRSDLCIQLLPTAGSVPFW